MFFSGNSQFAPSNFHTIDDVTQKLAHSLSCPWGWHVGWYHLHTRKFAPTHRRGLTYEKGLCNFLSIFSNYIIIPPGEIWVTCKVLSDVIDSAEIWARKQWIVSAKHVTAVIRMFKKRNSEFRVEIYEWGVILTVLIDSAVICTGYSLTTVL